LERVMLASGDFRLSTMLAKFGMVPGLARFWY
jgi:uncharacterized membrane protein YciS (DUF1049 family)